MVNLTQIIFPSDAIDTDWFQDALEESNRFYAEGIYDEGSDDYPNRLAGRNG